MDNKHAGRDSASLGAYLLAAREQAGLSRRGLEAMSGVGRMTIQRLETDWFQKPSPGDLVRLGKVLELNDADLFLLAGLPVPEKTASLDVMLRTAYGLPPEAVAEARQNIADLVAKYDARATSDPSTGVRE